MVPSVYSSTYLVVQWYVLGYIIIPLKNRRKEEAENDKQKKPANGRVLYTAGHR